MFRFAYERPQLGRIEGSSGDVDEYIALEFPGESVGWLRRGSPRRAKRGQSVGRWPIARRLGAWWHRARPRACTGAFGQAR